MNLDIQSLLYDHHGGTHGPDLAPSVLFRKPSSFDEAQCRTHSSDDRSKTMYYLTNQLNTQ